MPNSTVPPVSEEEFVRDWAQVIVRLGWAKATSLAETHPGEAKRIAEAKKLLDRALEKIQ